MGIIEILFGKKEPAKVGEPVAAKEPEPPGPAPAAANGSGKKKTLPKDIESYIHDDEAVKAVFEKCDINAYGGFNAGNIFYYLFPKQ